MAKSKTNITSIVKKSNGKQSVYSQFFHKELISFAHKKLPTSKKMAEKIFKMAKIWKDNSQEKNGQWI